ncbi:MAG TPA: Npt1/Npt2 family nucleotide transporter [Vicinamibacterales bacterium]|nr:Npt1/Npt2 family nucleotide transporter [Vicinamibacterales bacterium]
MFLRLRRFLDIRSGEGLPVLLTFLYVAVVVASYLLAKPIRNGLFLRHYGPYSLVYVYAAVPVALSLFVPLYTKAAARIGSRMLTAATLVFFASNVLLFWYSFRFRPFALLPGVFYVWVNCFGIIAPVQAWSFANSLFDTRQAKRLFGLIGAGASFGAIAGGVLARYLVEPVGGTVNMLLVLAGLILAGAVIVSIANARVRRKVMNRPSRPAPQPFIDALRQIHASPYLRLMGALVFLIAIVTQWTAFQLSLVANTRFAGDADALTRFFGTFNFALGTVSFVLQLLVTGPALRRFGIAVTVLVLPLALGFGSTLIFLAPSLATVLVTNAFDQGFRFSVDKASYELLYLPITPAQRVAVKNAIDIVVNRIADGCGAFLLGVATQGFAMIPGLGLGLRGTSAINLVLIGVWATVAWRLRSEYVRTIHDSIHRHRLDTERAASTTIERSAAEALRSKLAAGEPSEVRYALTLLEVQQTKSWLPALRSLLTNPEPDIRRRALSLLRAAGDREIAETSVRLLADADLGVRTEALLYLTQEMHVDPLAQIQKLGDFEDFSIRAGMAAFLASPGATQNLDAARAIVEAMVRAHDGNGARERAEAARLICLVPDAFLDLLAILIRDEDVSVAREAVRSARVIVRDELIEPLLSVLGRDELTDDAANALARYGNTIIGEIETRLRDERIPIDTRRELPTVLVRIGTVEAEQALIGSLLHADVTLRHRVIASLNKLRTLHPEVALDPATINLLLAAEIAGHYRSYQVLGPLQARLKDDDPVLQAMQHAMEQELDRIFRLMALLAPHVGLHDAYVGLRSSDELVRANSLELLDNILQPELRQLLVPLLDAQVTVAERIERANKLVGAPLDTAEQAVATLLCSEDPWLRSSAIYAVGALQMHELKGAIDKYADDEDPVLRQSVKAARRRLAGEREAPVQQEPAPPDMDLGVGAG